MNVIFNSIEARREQGFDLYVLGNQEVEIVVVPELGAKIISLKNLRTGREWMWHPPGGLKLFRNCPVMISPRVRWLEWMNVCPPSRRVPGGGRELPDHGEVWSVPWTVDDSAKDGGILKTFAVLKCSPFEIERTIELHKNEIHLGYQLRNRSTVEERYLWAMHPLLRLIAGDQLELPASTRSLLNGSTWIDDLGSATPAGNCAKVFATPVSEGFAAIINRITGERLEFEWSPSENNTLGVWLTHGGWHGHHHFAIEPTNSDVDTLTEAAARQRCGVVSAGGVANWQVSLRVEA